jgi:hypothetical protein
VYVFFHGLPQQGLETRVSSRFFLFLALLPRDAFATRLEVSFLFFSCSTTTRARDVFLEPFWYFFSLPYYPRRVCDVSWVFYLFIGTFFFIIVLYNLTSFSGSFFILITPCSLPDHHHTLPRSKRESEGVSTPHHFPAPSLARNARRRGLCFFPHTHKGPGRVADASQVSFCILFIYLGTKRA